MQSAITHLFAGVPVFAEPLAEASAGGGRTALR